MGSFKQAPVDVQLYGMGRVGVSVEVLLSPVIVVALGAAGEGMGGMFGFMFVYGLWAMASLIGGVAGIVWANRKWTRSDEWRPGREAAYVLFGAFWVGLFSPLLIAVVSGR